jgi:hypothetical protein
MAVFAYSFPDERAAAKPLRAAASFKQELRYEGAEAPLDPSTPRTPFSPLTWTTTSTYPVRLGDLSTRLFRDFRVKWDKGFGAGGRRGIFLLQKAVTFSFAGFLEKEDAVVGVGMMV